jgi:hypothetical protein
MYKRAASETPDREPRLGFNVVTWGDGDSAESWVRGLQEIYSIGVRRVTIVPYWFVDPKTAAVQELSRYNQPRGPTKDTIVAAMRAARNLGMGASLKPMIEVDTAADLGDVWRGDLKLPHGTLERFFDSYDRYIMEMAALAAQCQAERFYIGSELFSLTKNGTEAPYWSQLISRARKFFPGGDRRLSCAANYDEYEEVPFWDQLDDIGIDAYFHLASRAEAMGDGRPDTESMTRRWLKVFRKLRDFSDEWGRPIVFSEFGLIPYEYASCQPWEWRPKKLRPKNGKKSRFDPREQLHAFEALLIAMREDSDWLTAVDFWHWQLPDSEGSLYNISRESSVGKLIAYYSAGEMLP